MSNDRWWRDSWRWRDETVGGTTDGGDVTDCIDPDTGEVVDCPTTDGGSTDGGIPEDCFDENGEVIPLDDPNYETLCGSSTDGGTTDGGVSEVVNTMESPIL